MCWVDAVTRAGVDVRITQDHRVLLADRTSGWRWGPAPLLRSARYLRTGDVHTIAQEHERAFVVGRRFTEPARTRLTDSGFGWALDDGRFSVDGQVQADTVCEVGDVERRDHLGAVALLLAVDPAQSQRAVAATLGVSQPLVHRLLHHPAARRAEGDAPALLALWRRRAHRPPPERQHWIADVDLWDQVDLACTRLAAGGHEPVVGGETAADVIAPWTTPATAVVHARGLRPARPAVHPDGGPA